MSKQFFFTDFNAINGIQAGGDAYGPLPATLGQDRFQLENKFSVNVDAPAIAICKSMVVVQEDTLDTTLLNIALLPLETSPFQNIPVKFVVYRGIKKTSLYGTDNKIVTSFTGWKPEKNILYRIKAIQDEINTKNQQNVEATKKYLGAHLTQDIYLEQAFFTQESVLNGITADDVFYPVVVDAGFEIGKFKGGTVKAGIQLIMDRLGYEPRLADLRKSSDIFEVAVLGTSPTYEQTFKDRYQREKVLAYMDYTGLLGAQLNNNIAKQDNYTLSGNVDNPTEITDLLGKFYNRNTVYFDIRDDHGFSYNHLMDSSDTVKLYLKTPASGNDFVLNNQDYYGSKWPILQLRDYQISNSNVSNGAVKISFPILNGKPVFEYIAFSYTKSIGKVFSKKKSDDSLSMDENTIKMIYSDSVEFTSKGTASGTFHANYFLIKLSKGNFLQDRNTINMVYPLHMSTLLGDDNLDDGDFKVYVYSSVNAPIIRKNKDYYLADVGIAKDKYNVTFFSYEASSVKSEDKQLFGALKLITTGNYEYQAYLNEFQYLPNQTLGFLTSLPYRFLNSSGAPDYDLKEFQLTEDKQNNMSILIKVLAYTKVGDGKKTDRFFESFDALAVSNSEYKSILNKVIGATDLVDYQAHFDSYFLKYLKRINFTSTDLSETFIFNTKEVLRYYPAFILMGPNSIEEDSNTKALYTVRREEMALAMKYKGVNEANEQRIYNVNVKADVLLNSLIFTEK